MQANEQGFISLTEAAVAVAVGLTLAAVVAPVVLNLTNTGKSVRAKADTEAIRGAIGKFFADTTEFPIRAAPGQKTSVPLQSGQSAVVCLRTGASATSDPSLASGKSFNSPQGIPCLGTGVGNFLNNQLVFGNNPALSLQYQNWQGPYIQVINQDPWGSNYLVLALGMQAAKDSAGNQLYAWILSAGSNGILETSHADPTLQGDDVGTLMVALNP